MSAKGFNENHPELRRDEVFVTNSHIPLPDTPAMPWDSEHKQLRLTTKRIGVVAYDTEGVRLPGFLPVFALSAEVAKFAERGESIWEAVEEPLE